MKISAAGVFLRRGRSRTAQSAADPWRRFRAGLAALVTVLFVGTIGYIALGLTAFDALYQTAITVTTVGYGEVGGSREIDVAYRSFTLVLVLAGASTAIYTVSVLLETVVEGSLNDSLRRRRMNKVIDAMEDHVIVAGWGRVGRAISHYAQRMGSEVVVIDLEASQNVDDPPIVAGDANDDDVLLAAGIERASVMIAALSSDTDNLSLTLTARSLAPDVFLVVRTSDQRNERKFFQAGADRVVNPHEIGGSRMGAVALQPNVAEFLDEVLHDESHDVEIHEIDISADSTLINAAIGSFTGGEDQPVAIAVRPSGETYHANPPPSKLLGAGDVLIVLGTSQQMQRVRDKANPRHTMIYRGVRHG